MASKKTVGLILVGALALGITGCSGPSIEKVADLTGDGITDVLLNINAFFSNQRGRYLFVGQKDGGFIRAKEETEWDKGKGYFLTNDGDRYFFDGQYYRKSPKQK